MSEHTRERVTDYSDHYRRSAHQLRDIVQTVEVKFRDEKVGSLTDKDTTRTLDSVPRDAYVVHVDEGEESWLETNDGQGVSEAMLGTFIPQLAEACVGEQVFPQKIR